jgi:hypothetical protein
MFRSNCANVGTLATGMKGMSLDTSLPQPFDIGQGSGQTTCHSTDAACEVVNVSLLIRVALCQVNRLGSGSPVRASTR